VFLTAHDEYALHAFEVEALDYLLKPLDPERFATCIDRVRRSVALHRRESVFDHVYDRFIANHPGAGTGPVRRFAVRRGHDVTFVNAADVDWIEGLGDYAGLHVQRKTHLIRQCLSALAKDLDSTQFLRIHRSTIVQIDRIVRVEPLGNRDAVVTLRDSQTLRASRSYTSSLYGLLRNTRAG
jgi:two-component system LytT family response regulator